MNKWMELIVGLILLIAAILTWIYAAPWGEAALVFLKGGIIWMVIMLGLVFVLLGISDLKN